MIEFRKTLVESVMSKCTKLLIALSNFRNVIVSCTSSVFKSILKIAYFVKARLVSSVQSIKVFYAQKRF